MHICGAITIEVSLPHPKFCIPCTSTNWVTGCYPADASNIPIDSTQNRLWLYAVGIAIAPLLSFTSTRKTRRRKSTIHQKLSWQHILLEPKQELQRCGIYCISNTFIAWHQPSVLKTKAKTI